MPFSRLSTESRRSEDKSILYGSIGRYSIIACFECLYEDEAFWSSKELDLVDLDVFAGPLVTCRD